MAFREVRVFEVREVLRLWLAGDGLRAVERLSGVDRKTVRRYVTTAEGLGLVNRVVAPELVLDEARGIAREIAAKSPIAVRTAKECILKAQETSLAAGLDFERKMFALLFATEDKVEGMQAFLEKREPRFKGS